MVFPSVPTYLDPANWQQQPTSHPQIGGASTGNPQLQGAPPQISAPLLTSQQPHACGGTGSIRPGSMAERARLANIQLPEGPLKCPRCESTNTKFCYFNNYSLTQPRHFCKTCRRYWTRGGALRNVPVGGGCRRNKRSKSASARSKSPGSSASDRLTTCSSTSAISSKSNTTNGPATTSMLGLNPAQFHPLRFKSPLGQLTDTYNSGYENLNFNYNNISAPEVNFGLLHGGGLASFLTGGAQAQQLNPLLMMSGLDTLPTTTSSSSSSQLGLYQHQFHSGFVGVDQSGFAGETSQQEQQVRPKMSTSSMLTQLASMKVEENNQELNSSRQLLGISGNDNIWSNSGATAWTDLSNFSSSSATNPL